MISSSGKVEHADKKAIYGDGDGVPGVMVMVMVVVVCERMLR